MDKTIAPASVRAKHLENLKKTRTEVQKANEMMDKLIANLETQISVQPQRKNIPS
jgi:hypothetical protein